MENHKNTWIENFAPFLSDVGKSRKQSALRSYSKILLQLQDSQLFNMGPGYPDKQLWPIEGITFHLRGEEPIVLDSVATGEALQYGESRGTRRLRHHLRALMIKLFNPPGLTPSGDGERDVIVMAGGQDALNKLFEMTLNPGEDVAIIEEVSYPGALNQLAVLGTELIHAPVDKDGLLPEKLRKLLQKRRDNGQKMPKIMYLNPTGQNPLGYIMPVTRMQQIYQVARDYKFLIIVDDPYYWLNVKDGTKFRKSMISLDTDGRVLRVDSFSKVMSPGFRVSFVTAPRIFVDKLEYHNMLTVQSANGVAQMFLVKLFDRWTVDGFLDFATRLKEKYQEKRENCVQAANKWLKDVAEWDAPAGGMFMWLKLKGVTDNRKLLVDFLREHKVIMVPGGMCMDEDNPASPYVRVSYSTCQPEQFNAAFRLLAEFIKEYKKI